MSNVIENIESQLERNNDRLIGMTLFGFEEECRDQTLIAAATGNAAPWYDDQDCAGERKIIIRHVESGENWTTISKPEGIERSLAYIRGDDDKHKLNAWQLNELFGFDGASADLPKHIAGLLKALPKSHS